MIDINLFTEQLNKCYTILNQEEIIIDNLKLLMNNFNTLDNDYASNKQVVTSKLSEVENSLNSLRLNITGLRNDLSELENKVPSNLTDSVLTLKEGDNEYTINATENDGLYIYNGREELVHLYDNKAYINNIVSAFTMPPSIKFDIFNSYASGEYETKLTPIPRGETLTINLTNRTSPINNKAFDWSATSSAQFKNSIEYLCNQTIDVIVTLPTDYGGGMTLHGHGRQISNNIFPSVNNPFGTKIYGTYLVCVTKEGTTYPDPISFVNLIVVLGIRDDSYDALYYEVISTFNCNGFIDYH